MHITLSFTSILSLFAAMLILAALPSISVLAVTTRSAAFGLAQGATTAAGVVAGDIIFIIIAITGLSVVADTMGNMFLLVKYLGAAYLVWLGIRLLRSCPSDAADTPQKNGSHANSFMTGFLITMGDQKAIFFYLGFFPAFMDLAALTLADITIILLVAALAVGGSKLVYAALAAQAGLVITKHTHRLLNLAAGCTIISVGIFIMAKEVLPTFS